MASVENKHTSGTKRQRNEFEEELRIIAAIDDPIEPEVQMNSQIAIIKNQPVNRDIKRRKSMLETLLEITPKKEEVRERLHNENDYYISNDCDYAGKTFRIIVLHICMILYAYLGIKKEGTFYVSCRIKKILKFLILLMQFLEFYCFE